MSDPPIDRAILARVRDTDAYTGALKQAMRWADSRRFPIAIFVDTWRLKARGVSRRVFRVERSIRLAGVEPWCCVRVVYPAPSTTRSMIDAVRAAESRKRAAPWEGRRMA